MTSRSDLQLLPERFRVKVGVLPNGCWLWKTSKTGNGYGLFWFEGRYRMAHRWAYEQLRGPIPAGLTLDHVVCDTPACVCPDHVVPATGVANTMRGSSFSAVNARKTHCTRGHALAGDNLRIYLRKNGSPRRDCVECHRMTSREYRRSHALQHS